MNLTEFYVSVGKRADTKGTKINQAETSRVLACMFDQLLSLPCSDQFAVISRGLELAQLRNSEDHCEEETDSFPDFAGLEKPHSMEENNLKDS